MRPLPLPDSLSGYMSRLPLFGPNGEPIFGIPPGETPELVVSYASQLALSDNRDWGHKNLGLEAIHAKGYTGKGQKVAVVDTGISQNHPDLKEGIDHAEDLHGEGPEDRQGHGSHCAGIIGARSNGSGLIGVAPDCRLGSFAGLNSQGWGTDSWLSGGIDRARERGYHIVSCSFGSSGPSPNIRSALKRFTDAGGWAVIAMGNSGPGENTQDYPGAYPEFCGVGALDESNRVATFSSRGTSTDICMPGVRVNSCYKDGKYAILSGTSMATPYMAGCLALFRQYLVDTKQRIPTWLELEPFLKNCTTDLGTPGHDTAYGWGLLNLQKLIDAFPGTTPVPPPPVPPPPVVGLTGRIIYRYVNGVLVEVIGDKL